MPDIDFEATYSLEDSGFDSSTVCLQFEFGVIYVNDAFLSPQELLEDVTKLLAHHGYIRLAFIPRDIENGSSSYVNIFVHSILSVRSLTVDEVGG